MKKIMNSDDLSREYPNLYKAIEEMGFDNGLYISKERTIKADIEDLKTAERFFKSIEGKTIGEMVEKYNLPKDTEYSDYMTRSDDPAKMEMVAGDDEFIQAMQRNHPDGKIAQKVLGEFFEGKYTEIYVLD